MLIVNAIEQFLSVKTAENLSRASILNIRATTNLILAAAREQDKGTVDQLDSHFWSEWARGMLETNSASSVRLRVVIARQWMRWCDQNGHLPNGVPTIPVPKMPKQHLPDVLTNRDIDRLLHDFLPALDERNAVRNRALVAFALATGVRVSELVALEWRDVDIARGTAVVRMGKGTKTRLVSFDPNGIAARWLKQWKRVAKKDRVFPVTIDSTQIIVKRIVAQPLGRDVTPHTLRRTWASQSLSAGVPVHVVMALGGWSDIEVLRKYVHIANDNAVMLAQKLAFI